MGVELGLIPLDSYWGQSNTSVYFPSASGPAHTGPILITKLDPDPTWSRFAWCGFDVIVRKRIRVSSKQIHLWLNVTPYLFRGKRVVWQSIFPCTHTTVLPFRYKIKICKPVYTVLVSYYTKTYKPFFTSTKKTYKLCSGRLLPNEVKAAN